MLHFHTLIGSHLLERYRQPLKESLTDRPPIQQTDMRFILHYMLCLYRGKEIILPPQIVCYLLYCLKLSLLPKISHLFPFLLSIIHPPFPNIFTDSLTSSGSFWHPTHPCRSRPRCNCIILSCYEVSNSNDVQCTFKGSIKS